VVTKRCLILATALLVALFLSACEDSISVQTPDTVNGGGGEESDNNIQQPPTPSDPSIEPTPEPEEPAAAEAPPIICDDPFRGRERAKPALSVELLPQPEEGLLFDPLRVIGFTFADGQPALIASPAQAYCLVAEELGGGLALGIVWTFAGDNGEPDGFVLAVNRETGEGTLVNLDFTEFRPIGMSSFPVDGDLTEPLDVLIRADGVCFRLESQRFCSQDEMLAVRSFQPDRYSAAVVEPLARARARLVEYGYLEGDEPILEGEAISEIEDRARIGECFPGESGSCPADVILAAVDGAPESALKGVLVVELPVRYAGDEAILPPGSYAVYVEVAEDGTPEVALVVGVTEDDEEFAADIPAVRAPDVDESGEAITAAIATCRLFNICLFWECQ
jgi:hypothetical protein